jgi:hypothetical protein
MTGLVLDLQRQTLSDGTHSATLERRQARLIAHLAVAPLCMPESGPTLAWNAVRVQISKIRKRLREAGFAPLIVRRGGAYHLSVPVKLAGGSWGIVIPDDMVQALRTLLWSHPDEAAAEPFLVML